MDRKIFFSTVRNSIFGGRLNQRQVDGMDAILTAWEDTGASDERWLACILGQCYLEVGKNMYPVREGFKDSDKASMQHVAALYASGKIMRNYAAIDPETGESYFGRGQVQLTHEENYANAGEKIGIDLRHRPERALEPAVSAKILVRGCTEGWFRNVNGKPAACSTYLNADVTDWRGARNITNGDRRGEDLEEVSVRFLQAIKQANAKTPLPTTQKGTIMGAILQSVLRHLLTAAAGFLVAQGWLDAGAADQVMNLLLTLVGVVAGGFGLGWGIMDKNKAP